MDKVNLVSAENVEGTIDVAKAVGSTEMLMFVYDLAPGQGSSPYHYSTTRCRGRTARRAGTGPTK